MNSPTPIAFSLMQQTEVLNRDLRHHGYFYPDTPQDAKASKKPHARNYVIQNVAAPSDFEQQPKIALMMSRLTDVIPDGTTTGYFVPYDYITAINNAGGQVILTDYDHNPEAVVEACGGLLVIGGYSPFPKDWYLEGSVSPYSQINDSIAPTSRARAEANLLDAFRKKNKAILGICNGMQTLAVHFGQAKLTGNLEQTNRAATKHHGEGIEHDVNLTDQSLLAEITQMHSIRVNTFHREAVAVIPTNSPVMISGRAPDGTIEAVELKDYPFALGVQFHPEKKAARDTDPASAKIFERFIQGAKASGFSR